VIPRIAHWLLTYIRSLRLCAAIAAVFQGSRQKVAHYVRDLLISPIGWASNSLTASSTFNTLTPIDLNTKSLQTHYRSLDSLGFGCEVTPLKQCQVYRLGIRRGAMTMEYGISPTDDYLSSLESRLVFLYTITFEQTESDERINIQ
jgi:hypothetical protein